jgi:iron complex outermembrane receptor protein
MKRCKALFVGVLVFISLSSLSIDCGWLRLHGAGAGISFMCFDAAWAEEAIEQGQKDYEVFDLGEIFVTAEKQPAVLDVAVTTEVTQEEIKATNSHTVAEALRYVPGVIVSTGRKNEPNVEIRGLDQSKTLILIDGVPYYETNYGKLDLNQIPVDNIAKIVVTKGGASVLYGPNAFAGVVNIITKKPADKFSADALVEIGDYGNYKLSLSNGMKVGIFNYWLNYIHEESNGWRMSDDFEPREGSITYRPGPTVDAILEDGGSRNNSDFKRDSFSAKVGLEPKDGEYYLNFYYIDREKGMPSSIDSNTVFLFRPAFSTFARMTRYDDWAIDLSGQQKVLEQLTLKTKLFYHNHIDDYTSFSDPEFEDEIAVSTFKDYALGGFVTADYMPVEWDIVRVALRYNVDSHKERDDDYLPFAERTSYTGSVALENEFNQLKNFSLVVGASYDFFNITKAEMNVVDDSGNFLEQESLDEPSIMKQLNPMIGATYTLSDSTRIFGSIARKVRFPTLQSLYSGRSGNPNLKPENTVNYTLGVAQSFSKNIRGELALFYHDISDYITRDAPGVLGIYQNFAKISLAGFELTGEVTPMEALSIRVAYTFNSARDRSPGRVTDNVLYIPEHKVDVGAYYIIPYIKTRLDLIGLYVGKTYGQLPTITYPDDEAIQNDDYFIMNGRISKVFLKNYEAYLAVNNIFDNDYEPEIGFPGQGRNFYVGLTARF